MKVKLFLASLAFLVLASGCASMAGRDYNNWGTPENSADGLKWRWAP